MGGERTGREREDGDSEVGGGKGCQKTRGIEKEGLDLQSVGGSVRELTALGAGPARTKTTTIITRAEVLNSFPM